jgi:hypothetical protein
MALLSLCSEFGVGARDRCGHWLKFSLDGLQLDSDRQVGLLSKAHAVRMCNEVAESLKPGIGPERFLNKWTDIHKLPSAAACRDG